MEVLRLPEAVYLSRNMQAVDRAERELVMYEFDADEHAMQCMHSPVRYCWRFEGRPVAMGGMNFPSPGLATIWMCGTDEWARAVKSITKGCRRVFELVLAGKVHRIQCISAAFHTAAHRWYQALGLDLEGSLRQYGKDRSTFLMFSRTRPCAEAPQIPGKK